MAQLTIFTRRSQQDIVDRLHAEYEQARAAWLAAIGNEDPLPHRQRMDALRDALQLAQGL